MCADKDYHLTVKPKAGRIKVFGERHTGTRAVIQMLYLQECRAQDMAPSTTDGPVFRHKKRWKKGFDRELFKDAMEDIRRWNDGGVSAWKHAAPIIDGSYAKKKTPVIFIVRDPYSWIVSFYRKPYHARSGPFPTLEAFLQHPWQTVQRDNVAPVLLSPMMLWNEKLRAYRRFIEAAPVPATVLYFEDFVQNPVASLGAAMERLGVDSAGLKAVDQPTKSWGLSEADRVAYYKSEAWAAKISPTSAALINRYLDWGVAGYFGYSQRSPLAF